MSLPRCMRFWRTSRSFTAHRGTDSDLVPRSPDSIHTRSRVMRWVAFDTAAPPTPWLDPNHRVFGSLAHCSVRLACCSLTAVLACSAICLPWVAADCAALLSLSFHPPPPVDTGACAAGGGGGGGGAATGGGGGG